MDSAEISSQFETSIVGFANELLQVAKPHSKPSTRTMGKVRWLLPQLNAIEEIEMTTASHTAKPIECASRY